MIEEYKEFEVGDFIEKSEVYTSEGSSKYRRMADFCNENGLVMKEDTICMTPEVEQIEDEINIDVYIISKPEPVAEPTGVSAAEAEIAEAKAYLASTDWIAAKCYEEGIDMHAKYPEECARRASSRARINELEKLVPGAMTV